MLIRSVQWGIKCKKTPSTYSPELHQQRSASTDVAVPDLSQYSAKETDSETRNPAVPNRPFPRRSGENQRPPERLVL
ncbi:hypothetical protein TNCV_282511 [Trichonephila clavipes]|nr:hypothetical protein TNCV_282511 [Trichonephila clavipes]